MNVIVFDRIVYQNRMKTEKPSLQAAKDVLVNGVSPTEAADKYGCKPNLVSMTARKILKTVIQFTDVEKAILAGDIETAKLLLNSLKPT